MADIQNMFPTEVIELPSKGLLYPKESPLSSGTVEMRYMTAAEEDILTNQNYIEKGIVIDKLLQSMIVDKTIKYDDLLIGDKNALILSARILGYGAEYEVEYKGEKHTIDLSSIECKEIDEELFKDSKNEFSYTLPASKIEITFRLLTQGDEKRIEEEIKRAKKLDKDASPELTTRLKHMVTSVNGERDPKVVESFVKTAFPAKDAREFRKYIQEIQPDIIMKFYPEDGPEGGVDIPVGVSFFWPDAGI